MFYEMLMDNHTHPFVFTTPQGYPWRRSNFRQRYWRPGTASTQTTRTPMITSRRSCHGSPSTKDATHATWLTEDGIPEVARRARLGQKMKGMARIYDHVTNVMKKQIRDALEA
jgi:hypothetical protein